MRQVLALEPDGATGGSSALALLSASAEIRAAAGEACARGEALCAHARAARRRAERTRLASRRFRRYARVEGSIEGEPSVAVVFRDGTVTGHARVLRRIELVVALGDAFDGGRLKASAGTDPLVTTLTAARALDDIAAVDIYGGVASPPDAVGPVPEAPAILPARREALARRYRRDASGASLVVEGELDLTRAAELEHALAVAARGTRALTLDVREVSLLDASILSVLVRTRQHLAQAGTSFEVSGAHGIVRQVFEACGLDDLLAD